MHKTNSKIAIEPHTTWTARVKHDGDGCKATLTGFEGKHHVVKHGRGPTPEQAIGRAFGLTRAGFATAEDELSSIKSLARHHEFEIELRGNEIRIAA